MRELDKPDTQPLGRKVEKPPAVPPLQKVNESGSVVVDPRDGKFYTSIPANEKANP